MSMLVIGGDSRLGKALIDEAARRLIKVSWTSRRPEYASVYHLDMRCPGDLSPAAWKDASHVVIVAAITGIVRCERDPAAWLVNADAPASIARQVVAMTRSCWFVSSDAVEVAPHTAYAKQKFYAELAVLSAGGSIFRPSAISEGQYTRAAGALMSAILAQPAPRLVRWRAEP